MSFCRVSVRYESERNLLYFRFRRFLRQEFSMEVDFFEEDDIIVDVRALRFFF